MERLHLLHQPELRKREYGFSENLFKKRLEYRKGRI